MHLVARFIVGCHFVAIVAICACSELGVPHMFILHHSMSALISLAFLLVGYRYSAVTWTHGHLILTMAALKGCLNW